MVRFASTLKILARHRTMSVYTAKRRTRLSIHSSNASIGLCIVKPRPLLTRRHSGKNDLKTRKLDCSTDHGKQYSKRKKQPSEQEVHRCPPLTWYGMRKGAGPTANRGVCVQEAQFKKRKLLDTSILATEEAHVYKEKENPEFFTIMENINMIKKLSENLAKNVEQNTKREIKEMSKTITNISNVLNGPLVTDWLKQYRFVVTNKLTYEAHRQALKK
ncbi:hypothetical protein YQE_09364, partial [Dendroctonus ponderosae]